MSDKTSTVNPHDHLSSAGERQLGGTPQRRSFMEPKLQFIEPKLTRRGDLSRVTAQCCFGPFSPEEDG
ncbi:MAG: hypothetical protein U1F76_08455 [Candidatus Competibacteraceae bacterium]